MKSPCGVCHVLHDRFVSPANVPRGPRITSARAGEDSFCARNSEMITLLKMPVRTRVSRRGARRAQRHLFLEPLEGRSLLAGLSVVESGGATFVTEAGATDTVTVALTEAPTSNVVLSVTSSDTGEATAAPATLTFTPADWNVAQTLTITGVNDSLIDGN